MLDELRLATERILWRCPPPRRGIFVWEEWIVERGRGAHTSAGASASASASASGAGAHHPTTIVVMRTRGFRLALALE
jgi:hypothetical protein